ncbi:MAG: GNAT family N-acetyltransferase [Acidobacteria bacterium]|nr:GNAT family N-acetyltransferase [Acidobacteriota bacterium]MBI3427381.1 GNAT family N-acetyltransferase [Acidobacteriota bacterium]
MNEPNELLIRPAVAADVETLLAVATRTFYDAFAATNTPANMQAYMSTAFTLEQFQQELADPDSTFLLAELAGSVVGYAKLIHSAVPECVTEPSAIELSRIYIDQTVLGAGIGPALLQYCFALARQAGHRAMFLGVWEHNPRAQAFYRKWGFERVGEHLFQMGDDPQTDWWMMRLL